MSETVIILGRCDECLVNVTEDIRCDECDCYICSKCSKEVEGRTLCVECWSQGILGRGALSAKKKLHDAELS